MTSVRYLALTVALGSALCASVARAQPEVDQQVNAIFKAWTDAAATANKKMPVEAKLSSRIQERLPAVSAGAGSKSYPLFLPARKSAPFASWLNKGNFTASNRVAWRNFVGPATLAVTADGQLAVRKYKGHDITRFTYTTRTGIIGIQKRNSKLGYGKVKPLVPRFLAKMFPKTARRVSAFMAKRMIRKAVRAGKAPSALQVRLSFHRAGRSK